MKVFISWSGTRSKETAELLSSWIRQVIQAAETWISLDIEKGTRWNEKITGQLEQTKVGIICLNKDNLTSEWILFEAGALSKTEDAHVCTFLLDIKPVEIKPPLGQFQHTLFIKEDIKKLIHTINNKILSVGEKTIPEKDLDEVFEVFYPKLEEKLTKIKRNQDSKENVIRSDREILEEILQVVRSSRQPDILQWYLLSDSICKEDKSNFNFLNKYMRNYLLHNESDSTKDKIFKYYLQNKIIENKRELDDNDDEKKDDEK